MTDLSITAANVVPGATAKTETGVAGVAVTAGQAVFRAAATGKYGLSDTDHATAENRTVRGIALHAAAANQPLTIVLSGPVTIGATIAAGVFYYLSGTAGGICPVADVAPGDYPCVIGYGLSTTVLQVNIVESGVVLV